MSAATELQAALVAALTAAPGIAGVASGVFDGAPPRAAHPYLVIEEMLAFDWSTKTERGREHRLAVTVWDEAGQTERISALTAAIGVAIEGLAPKLPSHRIVSTAFLRERIARTPMGPWAGSVEYRLRTMAS